LAEEVKKAKVGVLARVTRTFRDMRGEMKKVVWPTKKQTVNNTVVVLCFMAVMAVIIGLFDAGLSALIRLLVGS
jgi:preprotein translocase subunit SecE